ncbi:MAG: hypothetical protein LBD25_02020 [Coriobacteriales bacterium]|nr:hypothetical protein [Coriobacteriales bacterium]
MTLSHDICLDDAAFKTASSDMSALKTRAETLKTKLETMYKELATALDTPAGKQLELTAGDVLVKPIEDLSLVIQHISDTLTEINKTGRYKDIFIEFETVSNVSFS